MKLWISLCLRSFAVAPIVCSVCDYHYSDATILNSGDFVVEMIRFVQLFLAGFSIEVILSKRKRNYSAIGK